jgi:hypothetical protein
VFLGSSVPPLPGTQTAQPQIIALPVTSNANSMLPSAHPSMSTPLLQQQLMTAPQSHLILVNGSSNLKRGCSDPILAPRKKLTTNQGTPLVRQALLLPSTQAESIHVIKSSEVKTVTSMNKSSQGVSMAVQSGVLVTNPVITAANQLSISAVIQNSNYQQTFIVPKICLPASVTPVVTDVEKIIQGNQALIADAEIQRKMGDIADNEVESNVIKFNPNVLRKSASSVITGDLTADIDASSDQDSDIEIIAEVQSCSDRS